MRFATLIMSCRERADVLGRTLLRLREVGWDEKPQIVLDDGSGERPIAFTAPGGG